MAYKVDIAGHGLRHFSEGEPVSDLFCCSFLQIPNLALPGEVLW